MAEAESASVVRPRRLRRTPALRAAAREARLGPSSFVLPVFIRADESIPPRVAAMPGVRRYTPEQAARRAVSWHRAGLGGVLLFGLPTTKEPSGRGAWALRGPVPSALRAIRAAQPDLLLMADVCLCAYTDHGHCGILKAGEVDNDASLPALQRAAIAYARAGADIVAPSAMMDGQVAALRRALDGAGLSRTAILAYSAKFASAFYGPFREAARCAPAAGDRRGYQLDPGNAREAAREIALDIGEGADLVMVKPALPYLDVIRAARRAAIVPVAAFSVSGEYAMLEAAAAKGWVDRRGTVIEVLTSIRRAGADLIITYHAEEAAQWIRESG